MTLNSTASAAPWVQEQGQLYLRALTALEDHNGIEARRNDFYIEWGAGERWTVTGKYEWVDFNTNNTFDSSGWRLTGRRQIWSGYGLSTVIEAGLLEGAAIGGFRGCESLGAEFSSGIGYSPPNNSRDIFAGVTLMRREHSQSCYHDRVEWVLGMTDRDGWTWTVQVWSERGQGSVSDKFEFQRSRRFGAFEPAFAIRREYGGAFEESALVFSLAYRHGSE